MTLGDNELTQLALHQSQYKASDCISAPCNMGLEVFEFDLTDGSKIISSFHVQNLPTLMLFWFFWNSFFSFVANFR